MKADGITKGVLFVSVLILMLGGAGVVQGAPWPEEEEEGKGRATLPEEEEGSAHRNAVPSPRFLPVFTKTEKQKEENAASSTSLSSPSSLVPAAAKSGMSTGADSKWSLFSFLNSFKNKGQNTGIADICAQMHGGTVINNECYRYGDTRLSFDGAVKACAEDGGKLWTPDTTDVLLYKKLAAFMPAALSGTQDAVLINAKLDSCPITGNQCVVINGDGDDISDHYMVLLDDSDQIMDIRGVCISLAHAFGAFFTFSHNCIISYNFICEYPIYMEDSSQNTKGSFGPFKMLTKNK